MKNKIAITTSSFGKYDSKPLDMLKGKGYEAVLNALGRKLDKEETLALCGGCAGIVAGTEIYDSGMLKKLSRVRVISRCGAGMDNIDQIAAKKIGIKIFNTPDSPVQAVSELTIGLIFDLLRKISLMDRDIRNGVWNKRIGNLLRGKRAGIVGFGRVGRKVAQLLKTLDCEISYADPNIDSGTVPFRNMPLSELLKWADIVSIHVSGSQKVIGANEMSRMKKGVLIVNTSRGTALDEKALYKSLKEGHISGAALDVFETEPYSGRLKELDSVILTPHAGSYAIESRISMEVESVKNLLDNIKEVN
jgi:D-3-phosphoglycerate dehydrogenase